MKKLLFLPLVLCSVVACQAGNSTNDKAQNQTSQAQSTQTQAPQTSDTKAKGVWIDVRSSDEYKAGHLTGAVNIVHTDIANQIASVAPNKDAPIHLYCRSGSRANVALQTLKEMGYTNVTNHGGYEDLVKQGLK
ncbi:rhodanese-like domain-containing protein [Moraxella nasibovis]|uniref:rhodanese-like domain-containing protein n=1 Tax=Moraxella nasibovis TaxID=2904120 RepID=UPI00240F9E69|nr:rhodanese-like domain-containing protein [Moraxella nasibovis]WFF39107.1 rhodanese-like domain-containing protein [Moraxella nasibovis]